MREEAAQTDPKPETIDSILSNIQDSVDLYSKHANELANCVDKFVGSRPTAQGKAQEKSAAVTVIQRLRDLRRQLDDNNVFLYESQKRLAVGALMLLRPCKLIW